MKLLNEEKEKKVNQHTVKKEISNLDSNLLMRDHGTNSDEKVRNKTILRKKVKPPHQAEMRQ